MPLFVVATPIGNLEDWSPRAARVLGEVDVIACEDTRVTRKLLAGRGIATPLERFDAHVERRDLDAWLRRLEAGASVALVSDAGTPGLSDPGRRLVAACRDRGIPVSPIPGPSALTAALSASGLPAEPLVYLGFIPRSGRARREALAPLDRLPATVALYESGPRLPKTLAELAQRWGDRPAVVAREVTKRHETFLAGTLRALADRVREPPKGEIVLLIGPPAAIDDAPGGEDLDARVRAAFRATPEASAKAVAAEVARATGASKRDVYQRVLRLKAEGLTPT
jgi:16S rRNA (cytidine1402-2'-O)-methyltransferase